MGGWEGWGCWGWVASRRRAIRAIRAQTVVLCSKQMAGIYTNHRIDRDGHWQQFGTQPILISAPQWARWPCNASTWFYTVGKKLSVKEDLAIYSQAVDVRGRCMSESIMLGDNLDFSSCDIMIGFRKSSHIFSFIFYFLSHSSRVNKSFCKVIESLWGGSVYPYNMQSSAYKQHADTYYLVITDVVCVYQCNMH